MHRPVSDLDRFWPARLGTGLRERLEQAYGADGRGYHDLLHLTEILQHVEELMADDDPAREAVLVAAWFHDAVYEGRGDDEERSARLAESSLEQAALAQEVARLVRLTRTHRPAHDDPAGQVLCDADLAILAADDDRYASYAAGVRREYSHVPDSDFATGRAAVLSDLLARPSLFHTEAGRRRWERRARANAERELSSLTAR
jgi:predicted metal-dependent HD superfamily phosphohydrolase